VLASVGAVVVSALPEGVELSSSGPVLAGLAAALAVAVGILASRPYLAALRGRSIQIAEGTAGPGAREGAIRIGATELRVPSPEQREAFLPGAAYRVFYLRGPVPLVLSAEVLGGASGRRTAVESPTEEAARAAADPAVAAARRARWLVLGIGAFVLQVLALVLAAPTLAARERTWLVAALFAEAVGFLVLALRWLRR
jgi:hypothetical protein